MQVAIALFPRLTALDAIGPYEVLQRVPSLEPVFVGERRGEVRTENGFLGLTVDATFDEVQAPDVVLVPGGIGTRELLGDESFLDWVRRVHAGTRFTTSVCSGSLVLAAAGVLDGLTATGHWSVLDYLRALGAVPVTQRVVEHLPKRVITAAGVSAGIDMGIRLVELLVDDVAARAAQVFIEYDPQPPFDAGHPSKVSTTVMERVAEHLQVRA
ncbi:DJ-1/PfpI family protein [Pseudonocardia nigra]|uniref:DJ-1/PfpI family protein n=1 Tax=Pseudonocardia nigra TaxID=1921578 RepID=UPI001C5F432C|nr:DJ-1/PfpI family protein [Pseudonocardia nigra]